MGKASIFYLNFLFKFFFFANSNTNLLDGTHYTPYFGNLEAERELMERYNGGVIDMNVDKATVGESLIAQKNISH